MGLKTYEEIEKHLEMESRNKKEDKKNGNNGMVFDNVSLGGKVTKFLRNSSTNQEQNGLHYDLLETEKRIIRELGLSKKTYKDLKKSVLSENWSDKSNSNINIESTISSISKTFQLDKDKCERLYEFINKLRTD